MIISYPLAGRAFLLKGYDRVLFCLDRNRRPMNGNAGNAYTADRRSFSP